MTNIKYTSAIRDLFIDSVLVLAMRSPYPKALTAVALVGTAWQRGTVRAFGYAVDVLVVCGLMRLTRRPLKLTDALAIGGATLWGAERLGWATGVVHRYIMGSEDDILSKVQRLLGKKPDFQTEATVKWDQKWMAFVRALEQADQWPAPWPAPSKDPCLEEVLKWDMTKVCEAQGQQHVVDLRHCLSQEGSVTIGSEEMTAWKKNHSQIYCLLNRSKVLTAVLSAAWATGENISCRVDLLTMDQFHQVSCARANAKLNPVTVLLWDPMEAAAILEKQGKSDEEIPEAISLYLEWVAWTLWKNPSDSRLPSALAKVLAHQIVLIRWKTLTSIF